MNGLGAYLQLPFAQHALLAGTLVAISCGLIGPFVISRGMAFAVHGTSELAFAGAAGGLLAANNAVAGALVGSVVVATLIALLGQHERERDSAIGVILAAGLGLGVLLLGYYHGFATEATNILFGDIFGVSRGQLAVLVAVSLAVIVVMAAIHRPLMFASVDPEVARARGLPTRLLGVVFLFVLAFTVTEAAQVVGTLLVLSLAITPAAAAGRWSASPLVVAGASVGLAVVAADGGLLVSLQAGTVKPSVAVTGISFGLYLVARLTGPLVKGGRRVAGGRRQALGLRRSGGREGGRVAAGTRETAGTGVAAGRAVPGGAVPGDAVSGGVGGTQWGGGDEASGGRVGA